MLRGVLVDRRRGRLPHSTEEWLDQRNSASDLAQGLLGTISNLIQVERHPIFENAQVYKDTGRRPRKAQTLDPKRE
jgi:hypothetical protein